MNNDHVFNSVQWMNLQLLTLIHAGLQTDPVPTAFNFHLNQDQCAHLLSMSLGQIQRLAESMASESLFLPRDNFLQLLQAPAGLASMLSAVCTHASLGIPMAGARRGSVSCA